MAIATNVTASDGPKPFPEFEARRIKPPTTSTQKRITIQIVPEQIAPVAVSPSSSVASEHPVVDSQYSWFWEKISPDMAQSGPGRLSVALDVLSGSGKVAAPRLQTMQDIANARGIPILLSTIDTQVSPALVLAVIAVESAGQADAVSSAGATGLMQLMPATAERFGVTDALVANDNIAGGVRYLDWLMQEFDNDPILVLAGYNAGEGSVRKHDGVPPYPETRDYVPKVLAAFQVAKGLCATPPELITDGCVFALMK
ncbi:MAG: lytic transglycosylase domain-containing protein [Rhodobacteraceae bacterium]|nr:lytic transglycosylase domain-containing protein [Paracoccaceae bacterium]